MNFRKQIKNKATNYLYEKKTKLIKGDYDLTGKAKKGISYASSVGQNIAEDMGRRDNQRKMFMFQMPQEQKQQPKRRQHKQPDYRYRPRSRRRKQSEPHDPYSLI